MFICPSVRLLQTDFCQGDGIPSVQDAVMKLDRCVVEIKMKAEFKDGCGLTREHY